jgi:hypothetical protein
MAVQQQDWPDFVGVQQAACAMPMADKLASSNSTGLKAFGLPAIGIRRDFRRLAAGKAAVDIDKHGFHMENYFSVVHGRGPFSRNCGSAKGSRPNR